MKKRFALLFLFLLTVIIAGCSPGNEYVGTWVNTNDSEIRMIIEKNNQNFIIVYGHVRYHPVNSGPGTPQVGALIWVNKETHTATIQSDRLIVNPLLTFTFIQKDGTILASNKEVFKKVSQQELDQLKEKAAEEFKKQYPRIPIR